LEVSHVSRRLKIAIESTRARAQERRQRTAEVEKAYALFLEAVATPVARQMANAPKVAGMAFTVETPGGGLRLSSDRGRNDFVEFALETGGEQPEVVGRISLSRGSRTLDRTLPVKAGATPDAISDDDVLEFLLVALEPWLER
jgi:hypothetical protein